MNLDTIDVKILQLIQENAQLTIKEIAQSLNSIVTGKQDI